MVYTATTFNSGNPPGIDAPFLDTLQAWITQFEGTTGVTTLNGSTSGTAKLYPILQGTIKKFIVRCNNFRNGGTGVQNIALPTAFVDFAEIHSYQMAPYQLLSSGSAITMYFMSSIGGSGFGATSLTTVAFAVDALLRTNGVQAFDTISFAGSQSSASTGFAIIEGI